jgi:hypothetical protein
MQPSLILDPSDAEEFLRTPNRLFKIRSWALLKALGLPTLSGIVISEWDTSVPSVIRSFAEIVGAQTLTFRSDREFEIGTYPRGGQLLDLGSAIGETRVSLNAGRTPFLLEPRSPLRDWYSAGALLWPNELIQVEVVGPGFDSSDLKRGDVTPHERFAFDRSDLLVVEHSVISPDAYKTSWVERMGRVGQRYLGIMGEHSLSLVEQRLAELKEPLLLNAQERYVPIAMDLIYQVVRSALLVSQRSESYGFPDEPMMVSVGFFGSDLEEIYWDVVWPQLKYEGIMRGEDP